jgi:phospholipid/cholesterol/gamma-HCH transport system substrate-binding protein
MKAIQGKQSVIVGLFILIGVAIFMAAVITLGGQKKTFSKGILVRALFDNVSGLQPGNNVWFSGVKVGTVKRLQLTADAHVIVDMNIDKKSRDFIHTDAKAKIGSDGLIGNKIVIIFGGTAATPAVRANDMLRSQGALNTEEVMTALQENNKNLLQITGDFKVISQRLVDGQGTIGKLLRDEGLADQLQSMAGTLQQASSNIRGLTSDVADYASKLQTPGVLANELVTDTSLFQSLQAASIQIRQASDNAKQLTANVRTVTERINDSTNTVGVLLHDQQAAANLRATMENIQAGTEKFDQDMEALQHNFLFRGFFRKKAKREKEEQKKQMATNR